MLLHLCARAVNVNGSAVLLWPCFFGPSKTPLASCGTRKAQSGGSFAGAAAPGGCGSYLHAVVKDATAHQEPAPRSSVPTRLHVLNDPATTPSTPQRHP